MPLFHADARWLPFYDQYVQAVITSPPYWGLRDYKTAPLVWGGKVGCEHEWGAPIRTPWANAVAGPSVNVPKNDRNGGGHWRVKETGPFCLSCGAWRGSLGLEPTPDLYVQHLVEVFREVRRVLRDDGTVWLNLGASYMGNPGWPQGASGDRASRTFTANARAFSCGTRPSRFRSDAPACGNGDRELRGSTGAGSACSDLCDGCLADFLYHLQHTADIDQPIGRCEQPQLQTGHDTGPKDSASASLASSLPAAQVSTMLESWRRHRDVCSRCDSRATSLSGLRLSAPDAGTSSGMSWLYYTTRLKQKDLVPIPWMVAMALQADGWYLRAEIIWAKAHEFCPGGVGSTMPESVRDRPTRAHETVFLLTKQATYYYDSEAVKQEGVFPAGTRAAKGSGTREGNRRGNSRKYQNPDNATTVPQDGYAVYSGTRNLRDVWFISPQPFKGAHFATFPEKLVEPCLLAGSAHWQTDHSRSVVLDPFCGSGTVGVVAARHGRYFLGCDLNAEYLVMARQRIAGQHVALVQDKQAGHGRRSAGFNERYFGKPDASPR